MRRLSSRVEASRSGDAALGRMHEGRKVFVRSPQCGVFLFVEKTQEKENPGQTRGLTWVAMYAPKQPTSGRHPCKVPTDPALLRRARYAFTE